jgi:predicted GNAT family acetyltransferase
VAARPFENAFLHWVLDGGHGPYAPDELVLDRRRDGSVRGVVYYGAQLVIAGEEPATLDAFAVETRKYPGLRSFVGPKRAVDGLWARVKTWYRPPAIVRERQPLYALWPQALAAIDAPAGVRRARVEEAPLVADHSAQMILGELGYDPRAQRLTFIAGVRRAIELGLWWVWIDGEELRFQCNVGAQTPVTAQLQGVWTPPALRGRGYATQGLAAIARHVLEASPTASLYVNDFNTEAIALYERVGFARVGELTTYLFP